MAYPEDASKGPELREGALAAQVKHGGRQTPDLMRQLFIAHVETQLRNALRPVVNQVVDAAVKAAIADMQPQVEVELRDYCNTMAINIIVQDTKKERA